MNTNPLTSASISVYPRLLSRARSAAGVVVLALAVLVIVGGALAALPLESAWGALSVVLLIAAGTFVSEDLACIGTGLLIGRGEVSPVTGLLGCFVGIYAGDLMLWAIGRVLWRWIGRWPWVAARLPQVRLVRLGAWFDRNAAGAILTSRFVPGSRLPLYLAAGAVGGSARAFIGWSLVAAAIWTPIVVFASAWLGESFVMPFERWLGMGAWWSLLPAAIAAMLLLRLMFRLGTRRGRAELAARLARLWRWEFWPAWLFYLPLVPWIAWLSIRHRGFMTVTAANPGMPHGGFVGESKSDILRRLPAGRVAAFALIDAGGQSQRMAQAMAHRTAQVEAFVAEHGLTYPIILKPDAGQRGVGVRLARSAADVRAYLAANPLPVLVQAFHPGPFEAGIFYCRMPGEERGRIFSITDKQFPVITGDGRSTLEDLIWRHPRFRMQASTFLARHGQQRERILAAGESLPLAVAGNHCQGTMFRDGSHLWTPQLEAAIDAIARGYEGFYFGRFDVRYGDVEAFKAGRDVTIIELNGATSESTNIYDPARSVFSAWGILFRQWSLLFRIAAANRRRGQRPSRPMELLREIRGHYRDRRASLIAD